MFLFGLAEWLEDRCVARARRTISAVLQLQPDKAVLVATGGEVPVEEVRYRIAWLCLLSSYGVVVIFKMRGQRSYIGLVEAGASKG